jgi:periplasmic protein TonB
MTALRVPFAVGSGGFLSLSLFYVLWMFVAAPASIDPVFKPIPVIFTIPRVQTTPVSKRDPKVEREPPVLVPEGPRFGGGDRSDVAGGTAVVPPDVDTGVVTRGDLAPGSDRDAVPLVRISPDYPPRAVADNIEGWVQVQFSITTTGSVRDTSVVAAQPPKIFDAAALKAIARWRYQPRVQGGVATERVGLQTIIRFDLEED